MSCVTYVSCVFRAAGSLECVRCLLDHGAEVDMTDMKGQTPLFVAVKDQHLECAGWVGSWGGGDNEEEVGSNFRSCSGTLLLENCPFVGAGDKAAVTKTYLYCSQSRLITGTSSPCCMCLILPVLPPDHPRVGGSGCF